LVLLLITLVTPWWTYTYPNANIRSVQITLTLTPIFQPSLTEWHSPLLKHADEVATHISMEKLKQFNQATLVSIIVASLLHCAGLIYRRPLWRKKFTLLCGLTLTITAFFFVIGLNVALREFKYSWASLDGNLSEFSIPDFSTYTFSGLTLGFYILIATITLAFLFPLRRFITRWLPESICEKAPA